MKKKQLSFTQKKVAGIGKIIISTLVIAFSLAVVGCSAQPTEAPGGLPKPEPREEIELIEGEEIILAAKPMNLTPRTISGCCLWRH